MKKLIKSGAVIILALFAFSSFASNTLTISSKATGKSAVAYLQSLDNQTDGYLRALRRGSQVDWDALVMSVQLNQSANLEAKLDILIAEMRKNNELLAKLAKK